MQKRSVHFYFYVPLISMFFWNIQATYLRSYSDQSKIVQCYIFLMSFLRMSGDRGEKALFLISLQMCSTRMLNPEKRRRVSTPDENSNSLASRGSGKWNAIKNKFIWSPRSWESYLQFRCSFNPSNDAFLLLTSFTDSASQSPSAFQPARLIRLQ